MDSNTTVVALTAMLIFLIIGIVFQFVAFAQFKRRIFSKLDDTNDRVSLLNNLIVNDFKSVLDELKRITK